MTDEQPLAIRSAAEVALPTLSNGSSSSPLGSSSSSSLNPSAMATLESSNAQQYESRISHIQQLINKQLHVTIKDGRLFIGTFMCTDQWNNMVLVHTEEHRDGRLKIHPRQERLTRPVLNLTELLL